MADLKPPKRIRMGPHTYKVRTDTDALNRLRGEQRRGDSHPDQCTIAVDTGNPHTMAAETLLHELTHCAWAQTALAADDDLSKAEEAVVLALSPLLLDALRSNPKLVRFLTG